MLTKTHEDCTGKQRQGCLLEVEAGLDYREVIATEVSKASVQAADYNIEANTANNVHVARLSAEEFVQAWRGERDFFRMKGMPEVKGRKFQTLLVSNFPPSSSRFPYYVYKCICEGDAEKAGKLESLRLPYQAGLKQQSGKFSSGYYRS